MNPTAYIETSVISYLTSRPSRDVVVTAYQQVPREFVISWQLRLLRPTLLTAFAAH